MTPSNPLHGRIAGAFRQNQTFAVISHVRPDGDAIGCELATALCLLQLGKSVKVWNEDGLLEKFAYLPGSELLSLPPGEPEDFDVAILLDTAVRERAGTCLASVRSAKTWINIDHHSTNSGFGDIALVDPSAPATGQILFELFRSENLPFTAAIADNLFVAIATDTGSFQYPATTARTYEIAAELIRMGVDVGELSRKTFESVPRRRIELLREVLNRTEFHAGGRIAVAAVDMAAVAAVGAKPEDNEGLIDTIRSVDGVIVAAFLEELDDDKVRISLRSKDHRVDVSAIASQLGGGGHKLAAGARKRGTLAEVKSTLLTAIEHALPH